MKMRHWPPRLPHALLTELRKGRESEVSTQQDIVVLHYSTMIMPMSGFGDEAVAA